MASRDADARCSSCLRNEVLRACELCESPVCRGCMRTLDAETFSFLTPIPPELSKTRYCPQCDEERVAPARNAYQATLEQAKGVYVFFKTQRQAIPIIRKSRERLEVAACPDRDETILRLAFRAAERSMNAIIDVEVECDKVRNAGYQKMSWRGSGYPASVDAEKVERY